MNFKLGVLILHGIGNQDAGFANEIIEDISRKVRGKGSLSEEICFEPVWWAPVLAKKEEDLLRNINDGTLDIIWQRKLIVHVLADAIAYQKPPKSDDQIDVYDEIHQTIGKAMGNLRRRLRSNVDPGTPEAPLVIIAHSLGCHMISNYIWDIRRRGEKAPDNPFERFETLASIITMGCNIPLFTLAHTNLEPITFPTPGISGFFPPGTEQSKIDQVTKWLNFYDPDDILGFPLRPLDPKFAATVSEDVIVNAGNPLISWNPGCHTAYWTDDDVTRPIAALLHNILLML